MRINVVEPGRADRISGMVGYAVVSVRAQPLDGAQNVVIATEVPDDHDRRDRSAAVKYTRETHVLTTGVLYEVEQLSLMDHLQALKAIAKGFDLEPSTRDVLKSFYPEF